MIRQLTIAATGLLLIACQVSEPAARDAGACEACPEPEPPRPLRVLVLGDRTGRPDDARFRAALEQGARLKPDAILCVGDLIDGYQPDDRIAEAAAEWDEVLGAIRETLGEKPLYLTPGNHDAWSPASEDLFARVIGHPVNHSFDLGGARVIIFDTSRVKREADIGDEQLDWLVRELYRARGASARIVVTHRPLFAIGEGGEYGSPLHDVLIAGRADWVLTGHWHHAMSDDRDEIRYRMIGPSGARANRPGHPESGNFQQLGLLTVERGEVELSLIRVGSLLDSDSYPYAFNQLEWKIENGALATDGFELDPTRPPTRGSFELAVTNVTKETLTGKLALETPGDGWTLRPRTVAVELPSGETLRRRVTYAREKGAPIFPGPRVTLSFPWPGEGDYLLDTRLVPILTRRLGPVPGPPVVDGDLEEMVWKKASVVGRFEDESDPPLPGATEVRAATWEGVLFVAARLEEPEMATRYDGRSPGDAPEEGDHLLVLIDADPEEPSHVKIVAGISGALAVRREGGGDAGPVELPSGAECRLGVRRAERYWTVELALPLAELGVPEGVRSVRVNFARVRPDPAGLSWGTWQPFAEHETPAFGELGWK